MKTPVSDKELMNDLIYASLMALFYAAIVGGYLLCLGITYGRLRERQAVGIVKPCSDCEEKARNEQLVKNRMLQAEVVLLNEKLHKAQEKTKKSVTERGVEN